jgi:antibiotic biosynthesis monooxygenase (ABM) superfamily enzyme
MNAASAHQEVADPGATVVITHRVRKDRHADYEWWLNEIAPLCPAAPGSARPS